MTGGHRRGTGEHPRGAGELTRLARFGFADPGAAASVLAELGVLGGAVTSPVLPALADAADPDLAVRGLGRLVAAVEDRAQLLTALVEQPGLRQRLVGVLGGSAALGDHLVRHPAQWESLAGPVDAVRPTRLGLEETLLSAADAPDPLDALRVGYRRCLLGLAARDLTGVLAVEDVAGELADVAGATLAAALAIARRQLPPDAPPCRLAVIALGKCGGRELNYVSDVDVVFVAEPTAADEAAADGGRAPADEAAAAGGRAAAERDRAPDKGERAAAGGDRTTAHGDDAAALRTATALAAAVIRICSAATAEGAIWPVDAGLRPEGRHGPLVRTVASHEAYYSRWAKTWEFQALVRARPVAGDLELGRTYVDRLAPLVWRSADRAGFVEEVQVMRRRVADQLPAGAAERELKLGPGGLRDVEFAVQLLQLVHGRTDPTLRSGTTLVALEALAAGGYIGREDAARLAAAYRFLRTVEHRLQLQRLRRTHLLPSDPAGLRWLGRSMGYRADPVGDLLTEHAAHAREVRRLHEKLFYRPLLAAVARLPSSDARLTPVAAQHRLEALGFRDPAGALRHLEALTTGVTRRAAIQRTLLPVLLGWFADAPDPDAGLLSFRQVSEALATTHWYLRLLRDEGVVAERLARLLATTRYAADLLGRAPEAVTLLAADAELRPRAGSTLVAEMVAAVRRHDDPAAGVVAVRAVRRRELLRIAAADVLQTVAQAVVGEALADVSIATLTAALEAAQRAVFGPEAGELPVRLAIIAMGRLGGREPGYGSDADVLFLHDSRSGVADAPAAAAAAQAVFEELRRLLAVPAPDPPLGVDADLRPEGRQGPLTRSLASYAAYYARWSSLWEAQALLRAVPVAGDLELGAQFAQLIEPVRYPPGGLSPSGVREVRRLKARVEAERLPRGADPTLHTKLGRGGLADVEWTVQLLQLCHAGAEPALRVPGTLAALQAAVDADLLGSADGEVLRRAWRLATRVRNAIVLVKGRPGDLLPTEGPELGGVARVVGYPAGRSDELVEDYRRVTRRARAVVERVFYG